MSESERTDFSSKFLPVSHSVAVGGSSDSKGRLRSLTRQSWFVFFCIFHRVDTYVAE